MSSDLQPDIKVFKDILSLTEDQVDDDPSIALTTLVTTAVHDKEPRHDLRAIVEAVKLSSMVPYIEPLTVIPIVVKSADAGAEDLIDLICTNCSAKEIVMAVEETVEGLERGARSVEEGDEDAEDDPRRLSHAKQLVRLIYVYQLTIRRLAKWTKSPAGTIESRLAELESVIRLIGQQATTEEGRALLAAVSQFAASLQEGADENSKELLRHLIEESVSTFANFIDGGLARKAFAAHFSRLVLPQAQTSSGKTEQDGLASTWVTLCALGATPGIYASRPSLSSFIILAHISTFTFSISTLTTFFPIVLSCLQTNIALDEVSSVLISSLAPLRSASPRSELDPDLIVPLVHLLPYIASSHSDPNIRHYTFRLISLVLGLSPMTLRFRLLEEVLKDQDLPSQMRIAAVGLLKEAVLEGLAAQDKNIFSSPLLLSTFGPMVLRPNPPEGFDSILPEDFLDSAEPLRLVECLGFYYVLLLRDVQNKTGVRDPDSLRNVKTALLQPIRKSLQAWTGALGEGGHDHDSGMQLGILGMWLERVQGAMDEITAQ